MRSPLCLLRTIWRSLRLSISPPVMGHNYVVEEEIPHASVEVLRCEDCGAVSVGWKRIAP